MIVIPQIGLEVRLIGGFEIRSAGAVQVLEKRKACAILAYLILIGQARETRGRLAALLWSESDEEHARASLRQCIFALKHIETSTQSQFVMADKLAVGVSPDAIVTDIGQLDQAIARRDYDKASRILSRAGESLCVDLNDCDPVFDNWLRMQSTAWTDRTISRLSTLLKNVETTAEDRKTIASCILKLDPFFEPAVIETLRGLYQEGGYGHARAYFDRYVTDLRSELDIAPSAEIARQVESMHPGPSRTGGQQGPAGRARGEAEPPAAKPLHTPEMPVIVIVTARQQNDNTHIQFALVSELSASLSRFRHWTAVHVELDHPISQASDLASVRTGVAEAVDLAVVISASGDGFEVTCYDFARGERHFMTMISPSPSSWRSVFNEMSAQVAARLQLAISTTRLHRIAEASPNYVSAYDSWLDGQRLSILWRKDTEEQAIARYEEAIQRDPSLSCAYSSLAAVLNSRWIVVPGHPVDGDDVARAFDLAKKAVSLDPLDHRNQVNLAWSHLLARRWDLADFHFGPAHDLNSSNPATLIAYALGSSFMGNHARALELAQRSFQLNPLQEPHYHGYHVTIAFLAGDHQACIASAAKSDELFPDIQGWTAAANALLGQDVQAGIDFRIFLRKLTAAWHNGGRPSRRAAIDWFKNVFPIREKADRDRLAQGIDRAAGLS